MNTIDIIALCMMLMIVILWLISLVSRHATLPSKPASSSASSSPAIVGHINLHGGGHSALAMVALPQPLASSQAPIHKQIITQHTNATRAAAADPIGGLLFATDPGLTYNNPVVTGLWRVSLGIADALFVLTFIIAGYSVMVGAVGFRYADAVETLPRIIMSGIAAHASLDIVSLFVGLDYAMIQVMAQQPDQTSFLQNFNNPLGVSIIALVTGGLSIMTLLLEGVVMVMTLMLIVQSVVRMMLINFFSVLAPLGLGAWALPQGAGQQLTRIWFSGFIAVVMIQFLQAVAYIVTQGMVSQILTNPAWLAVEGVMAGLGIGGGAIPQFLEIAVLWFILRIPGMVQSAAVNVMSDGANSVVGAIQATISAVQSVVSTATQVGMMFF